MGRTDTGQHETRHGPSHPFIPYGRHMCNPLLGLRLLPSPFSSVTAACLLISTAVMLALRRLRVLPPVVDPEMLLRLPGDAAAPTATDEAAGWMVCRLFTVDPGDVGLSTLRWLLVRAVVVDAGIPAATPDIAAAIPFPSRFFGVNRRARHPHRTAPPHRTRGCPGGWIRYVGGRWKVRASPMQ